MPVEFSLLPPNATGRPAPEKVCISERRPLLSGRESPAHRWVGLCYAGRGPVRVRRKLIRITRNRLVPCLDHYAVLFVGGVFGCDVLDRPRKAHSSQLIEKLHRDLSFIGC